MQHFGIPWAYFRRCQVTKRIFFVRLTMNFLLLLRSCYSKNSVGIAVCFETNWLIQWAALLWPSMTFSKLPFSLYLTLYNQIMFIFPPGSPINSLICNVLTFWTHFKSLVFFLSTILFSLYIISPIF